MNFLKRNIDKKISFLDLIRNCSDNFYLRPNSKDTIKINKKFVKFYLSKIRKNKIIVNFDNKKEKLYLPYIRMGIPSSLNLFAYHEHNIFLYYLKNFGYYKKIADIGGNIGLHSIILSKIGYKVDIYEPDSDHFKQLKKNLKINKCKNVKFYNKAIFDETKKIKFTQVINNTAANHIDGFKDNLHGPIKTFNVKTLDIKKIVKKYDLIKIDAEGSEAKIIERLSHTDLNKVDLVCEISGNKNAKRIFDHCKSQKINIFSHKIAWRKVKKLQDVPIHHTQGLVFLSNKDLFSLFPKKNKK